MSELPPLPALRHLGDLADARPTIAIDTREQTPLPIMRLPTRRIGLTTGDYSVCGLEHLFSVERKSIPDLVACCIGPRKEEADSNRDRFERELHRLRGFRFKRLLVIGDPQDIREENYRSAIKSASVLSTLAAFEARYDVPIVYALTPSAGGRLVETWAWWFARECVETVNEMWRSEKPAKARRGT